ncbi:MAG TPA: flagellar motor switch protein FliN [Bryobacteraceae bacterium]|jgi:flagellar motor switch protein FliN/FliY
MSKENTEAVKDASPRLVHHFEEALGQAIAGLTGMDFAAELNEQPADPAALENAIIWQQSFSVLEGPALWIAAGKDAWESLGRATLEAAGVDQITEEDCRSTWQEILQQTVAGVAAGIAVEQGREVIPSEGEEIDALPTGLSWRIFVVTDQNTNNNGWSILVSWSAGLAGLGAAVAEEARNNSARSAAVSKTFDLLLEVALPVTVSFGRTSLQIREVLKLNTGSIVELERFISDPVEVIVNDCVIARGEVVVVDGNYGVRINQLASREDRLRSGMAEAAHSKSNRL